jgi:flagellar basal body P-ring formation protein FlgA
MNTLILATLLVVGPQLEDINVLDAQLAAASGNSAKPLDKRLRLARCPAPIRIDPAQQGALVVRCPEIGWQLRVATNTAATVNDAASPLLIQRGESVQVAIRGDDFTLSYPATAMEAGRKGDPVRVKFPSGGKVLVATVTGHGRVEILD